MIKFRICYNIVGLLMLRAVIVNYYQNSGCSNSLQHGLVSGGYVQLIGTVCMYAVDSLALN